MNTLSFVIGATASGKTYFINHHFGGRDIEILDIYDYQQRAYDEAGYGECIPFKAQFRCLKKANDMHLQDIIERLKQGYDVVAEQTFYKAKRRITYIDAIRKEVNVNIDVYVMCPSDERWQENIKSRKLEGNFEAFKRAFKEIEFPNMEEGFDNIYEVANEAIIYRQDPAIAGLLERARMEISEEDERIQREDEAIRKKEELLKSMNTRPFWHYCEVCGKKEFITAQEAFDSGWDYPPQMGYFGLLSQRTCGKCRITDTLFWKIHTSGRLPIVLEGELSPDELIIWRRIKGEPESLLYEESD